MSDSILQIIVNVFITVFTTLGTLYVTKKYNDTKDCKDEVGKAIELAEKFANEIMPLINYLTHLYMACSCSSAYAKIRKDADSGIEIEFEKEEVLRKYKLDPVYCEKDPLWVSIHKLSLDQIQIARKQLLKSNLRDLILYNDSVKEERLKREQYLREFIDVKVMLLNDLEAFAMYFNTRVADEETVYQSLHQTFRAIMVLCYYDIALRNNVLSDKYYTNIIMLFNLWNKRYVEQIKAEKEYGIQAEQARQNVKKTIVNEPKSYRKKSVKK